MICICVGDAFVTAHLLFRSERNFLNEFRGLPDDARDGFQRLSCLVGEARSDFDFLGAFFHNNDRLVRLGLNGFNERSDILCRGAECSANLRTSSATTANPRPASPARAASMAALRARQIRLLGDVVDDVDNFRDFE